MSLSEQAKIARKQYMRKWKEKNRDKQNEYLRKWRKENPEKVREYIIVTGKEKRMLRVLGRYKKGYLTVVLLNLLN